MIITGTIEELQQQINNSRINNNSIGFVPTMGALHSGHLSLIKEAKHNHNTVVSSIYVNPLQFNNTDDFEKYPRLPEKDIALLENAGCNIVFIPNDAILSQSETFVYDVGYLDTVMEGLYRPGHFKGVAYIVKRFFEIVKPDTAYFGEKDYQQLAVIKKMTEDFELGVSIVGCPTIRESSGLAMSSRNSRLSKEELETASMIYKGLEQLKEESLSKKRTSVLKSHFIQFVESCPPLKVEYIEVCDANSLAKLDIISGSSSIRALTSVFLGNIRLIDNLKLI